MSRNYSNTAVATTLTSGIGNSDTTCSLASVTGFPTPPFTALIDAGTASEEVVTVSSIVGTTPTMVRGVDGTSATTHALGASFVHGVSARDFQEPQDHIAATSGMHGVSGVIVGTTSVQTLTNKTLTTPAITTPTITSGGSWSGSPALSTPAISTPTITSGGSWAGSPSIATPTIADFTNATHTHTGASSGGAITTYPYTGSTSFNSSQTIPSSGATDVTSATIAFTAPASYPSGATGIAVFATLVLETTSGTISGLITNLYLDGSAVGNQYDGQTVDSGTGGRPFQYQWRRPLPAAGAHTFKLVLNINTSATLRIYSCEFWAHVV